MNRIILTGRIANELEKRETTSGILVCKYTLAVQRDKDNTDFINCTTFGQFVDTLIKYCNKGDLIGIEGRLQTGSYEKDGEKRYTTDVITDKIEFLNTKKENKKEDDATQNNEPSISKYEVELVDDDLPF